jgi:3-hydroxy-9,10-secoandrosta-1,3,5(10)-triene-9,17-dione monooxygenase reductase component
MTSLREAMSRFPTGVSIVTTRDADGVPYGTTANALTSVSLDPPLLLICLAHTSRTLAVLRASGAFGVNLLGADAEQVARGFARSGASEAWDGVEHAAGPSGSPLFRGAHAAIECEVDAVHPAGDHDIVLGRVVHVVVEEGGGDALLWFRSAFGSAGDPRVSTV